MDCADEPEREPDIGGERRSECQARTEAVQSNRNSGWKTNCFFQMKHAVPRTSLAFKEKPRKEATISWVDVLARRRHEIGLA